MKLQVLNERMPNAQHSGPFGATKERKMAPPAAACVRPAWA